MTSAIRGADRKSCVSAACDSLRGDGSCAKFGTPGCKGAGCAYYSASDRQKRSFDRLRALDEEAQLHIARKYYGGSRPWDREKKGD